MSERCLVSYKMNVKEEDSFYDCIYTEDSDFNFLLIEWCGYDPETRTYFGPWKLNIRDQELIPKFMSDFSKLKDFIPFYFLDQCWAIGIDGVDIYEDEEQTKKWIGIIQGLPIKD